MPDDFEPEQLQLPPRQVSWTLPWWSKVDYPPPFVEKLRDLGAIMSIVTIATTIEHDATRVSLTKGATEALAARAADLSKAKVDPMPAHLQELFQGR